MLQNRVFILQNRDFPLHISEIMPIFAVNKRRKELNMDFVIGLLGVVAIISGIRMIARDNAKKSWKPKRKNWWFTDHKWNGPIGTPMI